MGDDNKTQIITGRRGTMPPPSEYRAVSVCRRPSECTPAEPATGPTRATHAPALPCSPSLRATRQPRRRYPPFERPALRSVTCRTLINVFDHDPSISFCSDRTVGPVLLPRRLEDPASQPDYVLLMGTPVDEIPLQQRRPRVRSPRRCPTCPSVLRPSASVFKGSPAHVSTLSGPAAQDRHPAGFPRRPPGGAATLSRVPSPFGHRHPLLGHPVPAEGFRPSYDRPTGPTRPGPRRGFHVPRTRNTAGVGAPYTPRPAVFPRPALTARSPLAASSSGQALSPRYSSRLPGLEITKHHQGFTPVHPPGLPLARLLPQTEQGPLGFYPGLRTPTDKTRRRTPGRGSILNTDRELRIRHDRPPICAFTRYARPRVAREDFLCRSSVIVVFSPSCSASSVLGTTIECSSITPSSGRML